MKRNKYIAPKASFEEANLSLSILSGSSVLGGDGGDINAPTPGTIGLEKAIGSYADSNSGAL